jgi:8-oxo-dGTP diphosphatase
MTRLVLVVAAALLDDEDRVLVAQRPPGRSLAGLWEFPGGKLEAGERPEQALVRELAEELGLSVAEAALRPLAFASHAYPEMHLLMALYTCRRWEGEPTGREEQALRWLRPDQLATLPMPPADAPLIAPLCSAVAQGCAR